MKDPEAKTRRICVTFSESLENSLWVERLDKGALSNVYTYKLGSGISRKVAGLASWLLLWATRREEPYGTRITRLPATIRKR